MPYQATVYNYFGNMRRRETRIAAADLYGGQWYCSIPCGTERQPRCSLPRGAAGALSGHCQGDAIPMSSKVAIVSNRTGV